MTKVHEVSVNSLGGLNLSMNSVVRLTDRHDHVEKILVIHDLQRMSLMRRYNQNEHQTFLIWIGRLPFRLFFKVDIRITSLDKSECSANKLNCCKTPVFGVWLKQRALKYESANISFLSDVQMHSITKVLVQGESGEYLIYFLYRSIKLYIITFIRIASMRRF